MDSIIKAKYCLIKHLLGQPSYQQNPINWAEVGKEWNLEWEDLRAAAILLHSQKALEIYVYTPSGSKQWIPFSGGQENEDLYFSNGPMIQTKTLSLARALANPIRQEYLQAARSAVLAARQHHAIGNPDEKTLRERALETAWAEYLVVCNEVGGDPQPIAPPDPSDGNHRGFERFQSGHTTYVVRRLIGNGGAGRVFEVDDDGQIYALKVLDPHWIGANSDKRKRFKNEIGFSRRARHPNLIPVIDFGTHATNNGGVPFYVMPRYSESLRDLIARKLNPAVARALYSGLLDGIEEAHRLGAIHRDLKPENILFDADSNRLVIADFGIAQFKEEELLTAVETKNSQRLANFQYAAPEQRQRGGIVDHRADIYALGMILNEMFTGVVPHGSNYRKISISAPEFSALDAAVDIMIRNAPEERPKTIAALRTAYFQVGVASVDGPSPVLGPPFSKAAPAVNIYQDFLTEHKNKIIRIHDYTLGKSDKFRITDITRYDVSLFQLATDTHYRIALSEIDRHQWMADEVVLVMKRNWPAYSQIYQPRRGQQWGPID